MFSIGVFAESPGALIVQRADLYYFSGTAQDAHLFIPAQGRPVLLCSSVWSWMCSR